MRAITRTYLLSASMKPTTVAEALEQYREHFGKAKGDQVQTGLLRFCVPIWGGPVPRGARSRSDEVLAALEYLKTIPLKKLWDASTVQEKGFEKMNASEASRRNYRAVVKSLVAYGEEQGWKQKRPRTSLPPQIRPKDLGITHWKEVNAKRQSVYGRMKQGEVIRLTEEELDAAPELREELQTFAEYLKPSLDSQSSLDLRLASTKKLLGWKLRYDNTPLQELRLSSLIPYVRMKHDMLDFLDEDSTLSKNQALLEEVVAARRAVRECKGKAEEVSAMFNRYRNGYGKGTRAVTFAGDLECLLSIAKFLYRKDTDYPTRNNSYADIPIAAKLKDLNAECRRAAKREKSRVPFTEKSVPWENLGLLLNGLKSFVDWTHYVREGRRPKPRTKRTIGIDIQRLLIVLFFVAIPPRRARVIRTLEVREVNVWEPVNTLERGIIEPGRGFIRARNLPEGTETQWFLRLRDYKTHKTYGDQDIEVSNYLFEDGTSFYSYLELWLKEYRPLFKPAGNNLFVGVNNKLEPSKVINDSTFHSIVQRITAKLLGVAIAPKDFRPMYVTYIMNRRDLSENERRAIAWAMGHSLDMQEGTYDRTSADTYRSTIRSCHRSPDAFNSEQNSA